MKYVVLTLAVLASLAGAAAVPAEAQTRCTTSCFGSGSTRTCTTNCY